MKNFIIGFVVAALSIVSAALIFVGKLVRRGVRTMPRSTKNYIKSRFKFIDIHKLRHAMSCSIKAFIDWVIFARQHNVRGYNAYERSYPKHGYPKWRRKSTYEAHPDPYIMDVEEYGCGYFTREVRYDLSSDKVYDDQVDYGIDRLAFIKDLIKNDDPEIMAPGNTVFIHDPRDGGDYAVEIIDGIVDDDGDEEEYDDEYDEKED